MFKVGDWVYNTVSKVYSRVEEDSILLDNYNPNNIFELWQPKEGEWCWFYSNFWMDKLPILEQFSHIEDNKFKTKRGVLTMECEPFIGELPSFLKGK